MEAETTNTIEISAERRIVLDRSTPECHSISMSLVTELQAEIDQLEKRLALYKATLADAIAAKPKPERVAVSVKKTMDITPSAFILGQLEARPGLRSADLKEQAIDLDLGFSLEGFPYKQLSRLKGLGRVRAEGSRFYLVKGEHATSTNDNRK
jgi:hypothetical protein